MYILKSILEIHASPFVMNNGQIYCKQPPQVFLHYRQPNRYLGFGALSGKMLLVRIVEYDKIDAYFRVG